MKHNKRAIEFSVNVIVIMVISTVILTSGLVLFNNLRRGAVEYVEGVDSNTQAQLRALMLNSNQKVSIYPTDITLERKKSALVGLGIINTADYIQNFSVPYFFSTMIPPYAPTNLYTTVYYYPTPESTSQDVSNVWFTAKAIQINNESAIRYAGPPSSIRQLIIKKNLAPKDQVFKNILVKVPSNQPSGLYVIKINIINSTSSNQPSQYCYDPSGVLNYTCNIYGTVKLYINVP